MKIVHSYPYSRCKKVKCKVPWRLKVSLNLQYRLISVYSKMGSFCFRERKSQMQRETERKRLLIDLHRDAN